MKVGDLVQPAYDRQGNPYCEYFKVALVIPPLSSNAMCRWLRNQRDEVSL